MPFKKFEREDQHLVLLRLLAENADYTSNSKILQKGLAMYGHTVSRDRLHSDIAWLDELGLVSFEEVTSVLVVKISQRGLDVAQGRATVPGIARPGPGA